MSRQTRDDILLRAWRRSPDALPSSLRSVPDERALTAAGLRVVGVERADVPEPEGALGPAPAEAAALSVPVRPALPASALFDLPPASAAVVFATPEGDLFAGVERQGHDAWLTLVTLGTDGVIARTVRRPAGLLAPPATGRVPGVAPLRGIAQGDPFLATFSDRPGAGLRQQVADPDQGATSLLAAHRAFVRQVGLTPVAHEDLEVWLRTGRRTLHVTLAQGEAMQAEVGRYKLLGLLAALLLVGTALASGTTPPGAVAAPTAAAVLFGSALWHLAAGTGGVWSTPLWALLLWYTTRGLEVAPAAAATTGALALLTGAGRGLLEEALSGGALAPRLLARLRTPAPVPADQLAAHYPE